MKTAAWDFVFHVVVLPEHTIKEHESSSVCLMTDGSLLFYKGVENCCWMTRTTPDICLLQAASPSFSKEYS